MHVRRVLSRRWRSVYLMAILFLAAANLGVGHAAIEPTGLVNRSLGTPGACNLNGWTTFGNVRTAVNSLGRCSAVLIARAEAPSEDIASISTAQLSQGFWVGASERFLGFYLQPYTDNPEAKFTTQTVSLHDASGNVIYEKSRNTQIRSPSQFYRFTYDLSDRVGQYIELRISVTTTSGPDMPESVRLDVDFGGKPDTSPETTPGPGW